MYGMKHQMPGLFSVLKYVLCSIYEVTAAEQIFVDTVQLKLCSECFIALACEFNVNPNPNHTF